MKLPIPTAHEIYKIAERAEETINNTNSRSNHRTVVENAIREAIYLMIERLNIQIVSPIQIDLSKQQ